MALTITDFPAPLSLAKNPVEFCFASDAAVIPAMAFSAAIQVYELGVPPNDGETLVFTFGDGIIATFTWRTIPAPNTFELPIQAPPYQAVYFDQLVAIINSHFYINLRLSISHISVVDGTILVNWLFPTTTLNIESFGVPNVFINPYMPAQLREGYKALLWLCIENVYLSDNYEATTFLPTQFAIDTATLEGCIDIQKLLQPHLFNEHGLPDFPLCGQIETMLATISSKRYKIKYAEEWEGELRPFDEFGPFRTIWGGVDFMSWGYDDNQFLLVKILVQGQFLTHKPSPAYVTCVQPEVLAFIIPNDGVTTDIKLSVSLTADTGAIINLVFDGTTPHGYDNVLPFEKYIIPVGVAALSLDVAAGPAGLREYRVSILNQNDDTISEVRTYRLKAHQPSTRYFMFMNSLGGFDTICTEGDREAEVSADIETAQRTLLPGYDPVAGQFTSYCNTIVTNYKLNTPFTRQCEVDWFKELMLRQPFGVEVRFCPDCCNCPVRDDSCIYIPILVTSDKYKWDTLAAGEFQVEWEYQQNFLNDDYTPLNCEPLRYPPIELCNIQFQISIGECQAGMVAVVIDATASENTGGVVELFINGLPFTTFDPDIPFILNTAGNGLFMFIVVQDVATPTCKSALGFLLPDCGTSPPVANDDNVETRCETPIIIPVLTNDLGTGIFIQSFGQGSDGVVIQVGNDLQFTPDPGFVGIDSFSYVVEDGSANTDVALVTVTVILPDAGTPDTISVCNNDPTLIDLQAAVGGEVGVWTVAGGSPDTPDMGAFDAGAATFNPDGHTAPVEIHFEKTVGAGACSASVILTVIVDLAPNAGAEQKEPIDCNAPLGPTIDLNDYLEIGATPGGTWTDLLPTGQLAGSILTIAGLSDGNYFFTYEVFGTGACAAISDTMNLELDIVNCL